MADGRLRVSNEEVFERWLPWARWYVNHLDPDPLPDEESVGPTSLPLSEIELTSSTRPVLEALGIQNTDELYTLSKATVEEAVEGGRSFRVWEEVCRVLEGLGYDTSGRRYWLL